MEARFSLHSGEGYGSDGNISPSVFIFVMVENMTYLNPPEPTLVRDTRSP